MSKYTIYLRRNKVNGKCYVGQTSNFERRERQWKCFKLRYANQYITADRAEFGLENFTVEVLAEADTREEAWELEKRFISGFNTIWPTGYNISTGGYGGSGVIRKKESNSFYGKHHSDETKKKLSQANKGKHHSEEVKQKISESEINNPKKSKTVYQYTLDGALKQVWPSIAECGRNGYNQRHVCECCNGKLKTHKGHKWSYFPL